MTRRGPEYMIEVMQRGRPTVESGFGIGKVIRLGL